MNPAKIIAAKRDGQRISDQDLSDLIRDYTRGIVPDYQMAAFAMAVYFRGMEPDEVVTLTREMLNSGETMRWQDVQQPVVDKHSTGGIGDKVSIPLAPMLAACGVAVPMISGRGLGATGGTLDKLESIPGFRTDLSMNEIQKLVRQFGCVISGATEQIAPADRKLYALRDVTATVPSIPLITASILSKKLAEGLDALVLDVKWGSGSFMKTLDQAVELANSLVSVAGLMGVETTALVTDMNQPLGMVGNALEVNESVRVLKNEGPREIEVLARALGAELLVVTDIAEDRDSAVQILSQSIRSGTALEFFERMVSAQGGDLAKPRQLSKKHVIHATQDGFLNSVNTGSLGWAVIEMGGGRRQLDDSIDHSTGLEWLVKIGEPVDVNQPLMNVYCSDDDFLRLKRQLIAAIQVSNQPVEPMQLIVKHVSAGNGSAR